LDGCTPSRAIKVGTWYSSPGGITETSQLHAPKRRHDETDTCDVPKELRDGLFVQEKLSKAEKKKRRLDAKEKLIAVENNFKCASTGSLSPTMDFYQHSSQPVDHEINPSQSKSFNLKPGLRLGSVTSSFSNI